jgi:hypothetical protein
MSTGTTPTPASALTHVGTRMNRSRPRRLWPAAFALAVFLFVTGCSSPSDDPGLGSAATSPSTSKATGTGAASSPASSTSAETPTSTTPVPSNTIRTRAPSEVSIALLDTNSFIPGVHVVPIPTGNATTSGPTGGGGVGATSNNPRCAAFVGEAGTSGNAGAPGVTGYANIAFQADGDPLPFLIEEITTLGTADNVGDVLAALNDSILGCTKITMSIPGAGTSTMTVSAATPPPHGDHPAAAAIVGSSGALRGLQMTIVVTGVADALLGLTFIQESESDIQDITRAAVVRATAVFTYVKPT